jgi:hypothetical protein
MLGSQLSALRRSLSIYQRYYRWGIEPLFRDLKTVDGLGAMWQRGRTTLLRWLHLVQIARTLLVLLTARAEPQTLALIRLGGWRRR